MRRELGRLNAFWQYGQAYLPEPAGDSANWLGGDADPDLSDSTSSPSSMVWWLYSDDVADIARRCD
jgi:hypothetical protein